MNRLSSVRGGVATRGIAVLGIASVVALPFVPGTPSPFPPTMTRNVEMAAVTIPPGGLITSFVGNQVLYCSIICPLLVETAVTAGVAALRAPVTFLTAAQSGDLFRAIGIAAASVTGPTNDAAQAAILADGTRVAPRALNALEVGVVGGLGVIPAAADGLPGIGSALQAARQDTFIAMNLPVVSNPAPTVMPHGVLQVTVVEILNMVGAIIFPAFNHLLAAVFDVPNAVAQELAATGKPLRAVAAGVRVAGGHLTAAVTVIGDSVVTGLSNIRAAIVESRPVNRTRATPMSDATATPESDATTSGLVATRARHDNTESDGAHRTRHVTLNPRGTDRNAVEKLAARFHRFASSRADSSADQPAQHKATASAAHPRLRLR